MNNVFFSEKHQGYVRENTLDEYIFGEVRSAYKDLEIKKGDVVLDLGANIGAFAKQAAEKEAIVHCYEPEPNNFTLLQLNSPNTNNHKKAVVGKQNGNIELFINSKRNKGIHMTRPVNGRESIEVETVSFSDLINEIKPNKIKIDVEGAEYDFLPFEFPSFVEKLVMEIHFQYDPSWRKLGREVHESMIQQGFSSLKEFKDTGKNWHIIGAYVR
jgi:FkbM family methyltransferase